MWAVANTAMLGSVDQALSAFPSHGLQDLKNASLMNRVDSKFLIAKTQLCQILNHCKSHYSILEMEGVRRFQYQSCYFDNDQMDFFHDHHKGKLNRFKVRHRNYVDTATSFIEVKFKNNKGRTEKSRISSIGEPSEALQQADSFLKRQGNIDASSLKAVQMGSYSRISLANEQLGERVTIDSDLTFVHLHTGKQAELSNTVIIELKQGRHNRQSPLYQLMRALAVRPQTFSKYCMGMALISGGALKSNHFKTNLLALNKFEKVTL
jgi:hypothetical protein